MNDWSSPFNDLVPSGAISIHSPTSICSAQVRSDSMALSLFSRIIGIASNVNRTKLNSGIKNRSLFANNDNDENDENDNDENGENDNNDDDDTYRIGSNRYCCCYDKRI